MVKILMPKVYCIPEIMASSHLQSDEFEAFAAEGMNCVIYAPTPTRGVCKDVRNKYKKCKHEFLYANKIEICRFPLYGEGHNPLLRAVRYFLFCIISLNKCLFGKEAKSCNVLFSISTPPIIGAMSALVKKFRKIHFVYNLQDIFPDSLINNGLAKKGELLWKIGRMIENFTYKHADKIIVISEDFKKNIMAKGVPEEKIEVIYNWVDQNTVVDVPREENKLFEKYGLDRGKFYVTYNGNIGLSQNMDMLLSVAEELQDGLNGSKGSNGNFSNLSNSSNSSNPYSDIHFVLVGEGAALESVKRIVAERGLENVHLLPFQPYEDISHVFSLGDVSLVISKPGTGAASVPSKTWSIMSASRPVLANFDENELKSIIEQNECGIFTKAGDKVAFTDAILKLYNNRDLCKRYGKNGRQFVMDNLTKEVGTKKYVDVIKSVCKK